MPKYAVITDTNVAALYGKRLDGDLFTVPPGEKSKTLTVAQDLMSQMVQAGCGRNTTIVALGGGMITDLAGFVASTFCRGVPLILIPTTLLAMVDAAIGGKTAVNLPEGKNLVGSYYFPKQVILHLPFLETLPEVEWENGIVEILKVGLVTDPDLFHHFSQIPIEELVKRAIEAKRRIVAQDPYETGKRAILNLGHTIGHALETFSHYTMSHGAAVAVGIVLEARLSHAMGILSKMDLFAIESRFPIPQLQCAPEQIIDLIKVDKKSKDGVPHFVLLEKIGHPCIRSVSLNLLTEILHDACLCSH